jgi:molybdate transport system substrate-binding protein
MNITRWNLLVGIVLVAQLCAGQELIVAAAADLQSAMQAIVGQFQRNTRNTVKVIYGSSGNFAQQLQNGAPFDMFFSADTDYPKELEIAGLTEPGTLYRYAKGKIVIWIRNDSRVDLSAGMQALLDPSIKKIAIANPRHAPYGRATIAAMKKENVYERVKEKVILGENISQTASFALSGSADIAIVALSLALSPSMKDKGRYWEIPSVDYPAIEQACIILSSSKNKQTAREFLSFIKTDAVADILKANGFVVPSTNMKP